MLSTSMPSTSVPGASSSSQDSGLSLDDIKDKAADVAKTFGTLFLVNVGCQILEEVEAEIKKNNDKEKKEINWRLTKKEKKEERGNERFRGELWFREGGGAGDFSKWKKVYVVEEESCEIKIYDNEKSVNAGKKPVTVIQPAGYKLITNVREHYKSDIMSFIHDLRDVDADSLTEDMEAFTWALSHPVRMNYMFLARPNKHKSKSMCSCSKQKVEPETASETEEETAARKKAQDFMSSCIDNAKPRNTTTLEGKAFDATVRQLPGELEELGYNWSDDGKEEEILVALLMEVCLSNARSQFFNDKKGPISLKLKAWYKFRTTVYNVLLAIAEKTWKGAQEAFAKLRETIEPTLKTGLGPIAEFKIKLNKKVQEHVDDRLSNLLTEFVSPFVKPIVEFYARPLNESLEAGKRFLEEHLNPQNLPSDVKEREEYLDNVLNHRDGRVVLFKGFEALAQGVQDLISINPTGEKVFSGFRLGRMRSEIQQAVDEILEAAVYTYKIRLGELGEATPDAIYSELLKDFDHDAQIVRFDFIKNAVHRFLLEVFHKLSDPVVKPVLKQLDSAIPSEFQNVISLEKVLDEIVNRFVLQPIEKMVGETYPLPSD